MAVAASAPASKPPVSKPDPTTSDPTVQPFLTQQFDPVDYLNATIPPLTISSAVGIRSSTTHQRSAIPLPELSNRLQTLLSQLNAQTTRLCNALTQLSDEIIRSGSRLAYEVEVLGGEATGLTDVLDNKLKADMAVFTSDNVDSSDTEPEYLQRLRTLTLVRSRLDAVVKVFGDAMAWPVAPSETAGMISISAPESDAETQDREAKGRQFANGLREEIDGLLGQGTDAAGIEAASNRVEELRALVEVWKGTAEEKARQRLVDTLHRAVDDGRKSSTRTYDGKRSTASPARGGDYRYGGHDAGKDGSYGFLQNLKNLKNDMYLE